MENDETIKIVCPGCGRTTFEFTRSLLDLPNYIKFKCVPCGSSIHLEVDGDTLTVSASPE